MKMVKIKFKKNIQFTDTRNLSNKEILNGNYQLIKKNMNGDCLCLLNGKNIIIIDNKDIDFIEYTQINPDDINYLNKIDNIKLDNPNEYDNTCDSCMFLNINYNQAKYLKELGFNESINHYCNIDDIVLESDELNECIIRPKNCPFLNYNENENKHKNIWILCSPAIELKSPSIYNLSTIKNSQIIFYVVDSHSNSTIKKDARKFYSKDKALRFRNNHSWMRFYEPICL